MAVEVRKALFGQGRQQQPAARHPEEGQERHAGARAAGRAEQAERRALTGSGSARDPSRRPARAPRGTRASASWRLSRSTAGRDRAPARGARGTRRGAPPAKAAGPAVAVERLGEQRIVVDVPAQRRAWWTAAGPEGIDRCGRRLRCRCEGRGRRLVGGRARMRDGVALGRLLRVGPAAERQPARSQAAAQAPTPPVPADGAGSGGGGGSGIGGASGTGVGSLGGVRRRPDGLAARSPGRPPVRLPRASARMRARTQPAAPAAATATTVVGLPTLGLGRTATSTERHLHLIGLKLETRPCRGTQSPRERSYPRASGGCNAPTRFATRIATTPVSGPRCASDDGASGCAVADARP